MSSMIRLVTTAVVPIALIISASHLLRAVEGPGDGFTAGIISALALTLMYETTGYRAIHILGRTVRFVSVLMLGLGLAAIAALLPMVLGANLLSTVTASAHLPVFGPIEVSQATVFDIGIALAVFGGSMAALTSLRLHDPEQAEEEE